MKRKLRVIVLLVTLVLSGCGSSLPVVKIESNKQVQVLKPVKPVLESMRMQDEVFSMSKQDSIRLLVYIKELERAFDECSAY